MALVIALDIAGAGLDAGFEHVVGARGFGRIHDLADPIEHETHAIRFAERARSLGKGGADLARGAVAVVGQRLDDNRDTAGPITLVAHFVIGLAALATGAALDRALDRVL